jgi:hypothetical protein
MQIKTYVFRFLSDVPRGTWGFMRFIIILALVSLVGCNRPDPAPELKDQVYQGLSSQLAETTRAIAEENKRLEEHKKALSEVTPQTGQIKFAQKRVFDSGAKLDRLKQEQQWLELRVSERRRHAKIQYLKAFKSKEPWPDPLEFEQYKTEKRLRAAKKNWDVRDRLEKAGISKRDDAAETKPEVTPEKKGH